MFEKYLEKIQKEKKPKSSFLKIKKHWKHGLIGLGFLGFVVGALFFIHSTYAVSVTWNGSVSTDWATAGNWVDC